MIRHTLLLRFGAGTAPPERDAVLQALVGLCDQVGEVVSLACGPDVDPRARAAGFTHAFAVVFGTGAARDAYLALPGYAAALEALARAAGVARAVD